MNPLLRLSPAVYAALAGLAYAGAPVPVAEHLTGSTGGHYVLLEQPTAVKVSGRARCKQWTCTQLVDVVTQFPADAVSSAPADALSDQVLLALDDVRLLLPVGWQCGPGVAELNTEIRETDGALLAVRRLLRLRWDVFYDTYRPPVAVPPGALVSETGAVLLAETA